MDLVGAGIWKLSMSATSPINQNNTPESFNARVNRLTETHALMARGYAARASPSGLIVFRPRPRRAAWPLRLLILPVVALFGFKLLLLMTVGESIYQGRLDALATDGLWGGGTMQAAIVWVMQVDPVTRSAALLLGALF